MNTVTSHDISSLQVILIVKAMKPSNSITLSWDVQLFQLKETMEKLWWTNTVYYWTNVLMQVYDTIQMWYKKSNIVMHNK